MRPAGERDEQITRGGLYHFDLAVHRDGRIAYSANEDGRYDLWLKAPGEAPRRLTDDAALDARPSFSADGQSIVFESSRGGGLNLWRISLGDGAIEQVTRHPPPGSRFPVLRAGGVGR